MGRMNAMARVMLGLLLVLTVGWVGDPNASLLEAAREGRTEEVRELIRAGADVNTATGDGMTPLHWASQHGWAEVVDVLLESGAELNASTRLGGYTPMLLASQRGHADVVERLIRAGADPNISNVNGSSALHFAAAGQQEEVVRVLLKHGASPDLRDVAWDQTPLMWAAATGATGVVRILIEAGADPTLTSRIEDLPAMDVADEAARALREERIRSSGQDLGAVGYPEDEAREAAAEAEEEAEEEVEEEEQEEKEEREAPRAGEGERPLSHHELIGKKGGLGAIHFAARQGYAQTVLALLDAGVDVNAPSASDGTTPLLIATINGHFDLALELLTRGADPNLAADNGNTPLYATIQRQWAHQSGYPHPRAHHFQERTYLEFMEDLLRAGADPDARLTRKLWLEEFNFERLGTFVDSGGATPFWRAAQALDVQAMRLLVQFGAKPHVPSRKPPERRSGYGAVGEEEDPSGLPPVPAGGDGIYPIHVAAGAGYGQGFASFVHRYVPGGWMPAMRYLVEELGADVNARDYRGYNALHHAASRGDVEMLEFLIQHGADVMAVSRSGQTTVDMANGPVQRVQPYPEAMALLERHGARNNNNCVSC
jgi:uncharacterized protein